MTAAKRASRSSARGFGKLTTRNLSRIGDGRGSRGVGGRDVGDVRKIEIDLQRGIGIARAGLRLEKSEQAVPEPAVVVPGGGLFNLVDEDQRAGGLALGDSKKRMAGFGRVPAPVRAAEHGAVRAARVARLPQLSDYFQAKSFEPPEISFQPPSHVQNS
jgi:hypothetical protein